MIRELCQTDAADLAAIHQKCFDAPWNYQTFNQLLEEKTSCGFVAMVERVPVGFILGRVVLEESEILTFAVDPAHQRQGIGKMLLTQFQNFLNQMSVKSLYLEVDEGNKRALELYESKEFCLISTRPNYYLKSDGSQSDAKVMLWQSKK